MSTIWSLSEAFELTKATTKDDRYYMICDRGYTRINKAHEIKQQCGTKNCGCMFRTLLQCLPEGWALSILDARHNHPRNDTANLVWAHRKELEPSQAIIEAESKLPPNEVLDIINRRAQDSGVKSSIRIHDVNNAHA